MVALLLPGNRFRGRHRISGDELTTRNAYRHTASGVPPGDNAEEKQRSGKITDTDPFTPKDAARILVERHWRQIQRLAKTLVERKRLNSDEVRAVLNLEASQSDRSI